MPAFWVAATMRSASRPSFPAQPVSISRDCPAGVTNKVACPHSPSTKNIRRVFGASGKDLADAGKMREAAMIRLRTEVVARIGERQGVRSMIKTFHGNASTAMIFHSGLSRQAEPHTEITFTH